jgi:hypothetical protein
VAAVGGTGLKSTTEAQGAARNFHPGYPRKQDANPAHGIHLSTGNGAGVQTLVFTICPSCIKQFLDMGYVFPVLWR